MSKSLKTTDRILESARKLFNQKGYSSTTLAEIAASIGIAQGNLTYHFPAKHDLAFGLQEQARGIMRARWEARKDGPIAEDYIEHLFFAKRLTWDYRFLLRDYSSFADDPNWIRNNPYMLADFEELRRLLKRVSDEGYFNTDLEFDFEVLARSLWVISRYWMDHLRELQGTDELGWDDLEQGINHHFELLSYFLSPQARKNFLSAKQTALRYLEKMDKTNREA